MGGSSGSEPSASPMISASENMSSAVASGDSIPSGSPASAVIVDGCHTESCGPSSGVISSGGTTTRGYSSLNGSSKIGGPWRYQGSSGSLPSAVTGMSLSSRCALVLGALVLGAVVLLEDAHQQEPETGAPSEHQDHRHDVDDSAGRERPVVDAGAGVGPIRRQGQLGRAEQEHHRRRPADNHEDGERIPQGRRGRASQCWTPSGCLADGRLGAWPSPGGSLDTSGDSTGRAKSSTFGIRFFLIVSRTARIKS